MVCYETANASGAFVRGPRGRWHGALPNAQFEIEIVESLHDVEGDWRSLEQRGKSFMFQSFDWVNTWYETVGREDGVTPVVVIARNPTGVAGLIIPLGLRRERGLTQLSFLAHKISDYQCPLIDPQLSSNFTRDSFLSFWRTVLRMMPPFDVLDLRRMPATIDGEANPLVSLPSAVCTERAHAITLTTSYEEFFEGRTRKLVRDTRRQLRNLSAHGEVQVVVCETNETIKATVERLAKQKGRRWRESNLPSRFEIQPSYYKFYERMSALRSQSCKGQISYLSVGGVNVATYFGVIYKDRYYLLMAGYEDGIWRRYSPGRILMLNLIQLSIEQNLQVFDLCVGDEEYKFRYTDAELDLYALMRAASLNAIPQVSLHIAKRIAKHAFSKHPVLKALVHRLRQRKNINQHQSPHAEDHAF